LIIPVIGIAVKAIPVIRVAVISAPVVPWIPVVVIAPSPGPVVVTPISAIIAPWVTPAPVTAVIPGIPQAKTQATPAPVVVDIHGNTGGIVAPATIALVGVIRVVVIFIFRVYLQRVAGSTGIAVYVGEYLTFQYFLVFIGFLSKIIAVYVIILLLGLPLCLWTTLHGYPF
jgi:hypothetical protein